MENRNILLTVEYDGKNFCGWQRQPNQRSVQGELERVLSKVCAAEIKLNGTSRTDAGVHAFGQRANFVGEFGIPTDRIMIAANNALAGGMNTIGGVGDVRIVRVEEVPLTFHARFDAKGKRYVYKIRNSREVDIFRRDYCYHVKPPLDTEAMREAAFYIEGIHDFRCFQSSGGEERESTVRTIYSIDISERNRKGSVHCGKEKDQTSRFKSIEIEVVGNGFLYNMVRIIAGTLVDVGLGKIHPQAIPAIIESRDRQNAGHTAPPQGLYLAEVYYGVIQ